MPSGPDVGGSTATENHMETMLDGEVRRLRVRHVAGFPNTNNSAKNIVSKAEIDGALTESFIGKTWGKVSTTYTCLPPERAVPFQLRIVHPSRTVPGLEDQAPGNSGGKPTKSS